MKAEEALNVFERAKETGFCASLRGIEATKVQYVKEEVEKYEPEFVDWQAFRREAAKDILPSVIEKASEIYELESIVKEVWCKQAVEWADELIKQLKEAKK